MKINRFNNTRRLSPLCTSLLISLAASASSQAAVSIISDDFGTDSTPGNQFRIYENTIGDGWKKAVGGGGSGVPNNASAWTISGGVASNSSFQAATGYPSSKEAEAPLYNFFVGAGTTETHLTVSFDYVVGAGDKFYAHLWGMTGVSNDDGEFVSNIEGSANGNANLNAGTGDTTELTTYNLKDGAASGFGGIATAISGELTGSGTYTSTFSIAGLGIGGVTTAADLDYYLIQFAQQEDGLAGTTSIDNFSLTATVPEPSTTALLGLGGLALILRRKK